MHFSLTPNCSFYTSSSEFQMITFYRVFWKFWVTGWTDEIYKTVNQHNIWKSIIISITIFLDKPRFWWFCTEMHRQEEIHKCTWVVMFFLDHQQWKYCSKLCKKKMQFENACDNEFTVCKVCFVAECLTWWIRDKEKFSYHFRSFQYLCLTQMLRLGLEYRYKIYSNMIPRMW